MKSKLDRLSRRLLRLPQSISNVARILTSPSSHMGYVGWWDSTNLGDISLCQAISALLAPTTLFSYEATSGEIRLLRLLQPNKTYRAICLGGGTLIGRLSYLRQVQDALNRNIPVFSFGTGVLDSNFSTEANKYSNDWAEALSQFKAISVRGELSADMLRRMGLRDINVVGDPALSLAKDKFYDAGVDYVLGINIGRTLMEPIGDWDENEIVKVVGKNLRILANKGWQFRLFSVTPYDEPVHKLLAEFVGQQNFKYSHLYGNPYAFMEDASKCCVFLGMKLHATILAYASYTPIVMLAYEPKCTDFMHTAKRLEYNLQIESIKCCDLVGLIEKCRSIRYELQIDQFVACKEKKERLKLFAKHILEKYAL